MYILVEIIHTEFQYISLIEMQKYNWNRKRIEKRKTWKKKRHFVPVGNTNRDKRAPLLSRTGVPGWETGTRGFPTGTNQHFCSSDLGFISSQNTFKNFSLLFFHQEAVPLSQNPFNISVSTWSFMLWEDFCCIRELFQKFAHPFYQVPLFKEWSLNVLQINIVSQCILILKSFLQHVIHRIPSCRNI